MSGAESQPRKGGAALAEMVEPAEGDRVWVYLWHWPIRAMHWIAALSIVVLVVTGFYIGRPWFMTGGEATTPFTMGWVRFIHFSAAALLVTTGIVRLYWLFAGNRYERLPALFPVRGRDWVNLWKMIKFYLMVDEEHAPHYLGHNPLQQLSYTLVYVLALLMAVTGFTMYGLSNPGGFFANAFGWVAPLLGGNQRVRFLHHALTWVFIIFIPIHVYLALRADNMERTGTISSILSGGRFVPRDEEFTDA